MAKNILMTVGINFGVKFWDRFCEYGQEQFGCNFYAVAKSEYVYYQFIKHKQSKIEYKLGCYLDQLYPQYGKFPVDKKKLTAELRKFEQECGTLITDIIQADRNLGRGFYYTGHARPTNKMARIKTYWDTLQFIYEYIQYFEEMLDRVQPDVYLFEGAACVELKTLMACMHRRKIPVRRLSVSRYKNLYHWTFSEKEDVPYFREYYSTLQHDSTKQMEVSQGYALSNAYIQQLQKTFFSMIISMCKFIKNRLLANIRKMIKGESRLVGTRISESLWVWFLREYFLTKKLNKINKTQKLSLEHHSYCYFPLHIEPEDSLSVCAPEFNNQVAVIDMLAKCLPSGVILVVKEHPVGISTRPTGFYEWLQTVPNVYIASLDMSGPALAQESLFTATITGTSGLEAAIAGVPVIAFSYNILYTNMKHVHVITDFIELRSMVHKLVFEPQNREEYLIEGQKYLQALSNISMDFGEESFISSTPSDAALQKLWHGLLRSLKPIPEIIQELRQEQN